MEESEFIVIPKKEGAVECGKHRTISIMSQVSILSIATWIVLRVVDDRLQIIVEETVDRAQFGFRKIKGTRNEILALATIIERSILRRKKTCFGALLILKKRLILYVMRFWWKG